MRSGCSATSRLITIGSMQTAAKVYERTGKREQAHEHVTAVTTMYREMDMQFCQEKAEDEFQGY